MRRLQDCFAKDRHSHAELAIASEPILDENYLCVIREEMGKETGKGKATRIGRFPNV
jgi:hypothetical protein